MKRKRFSKLGRYAHIPLLFRPAQKALILDMCCAFVVALVDLLYPLVSRAAMYDMLPNRAYATFFTVMVIVVLAYVIRSLMHFVITYWGHTFGIRVEADIAKISSGTSRPWASTS